MSYPSRRNRLDGQVPRVRERSGHAWTKEEEDELVADYLSGENIAQLADRHQRSGGAIVSRLVDLRLLIRMDHVYGFVKRDLHSFVSWGELREMEADERSPE